MRLLKILLFFLGGTVLLTAQSRSSADLQRDRPAGFSATMLDTSVDPCSDFYAYTCNKWKAQNPIPGDQPSWGRFDEIQERVDKELRGILEKYSADDPGRTALEKQIGDYYGACMDETAIEQTGTRPLEDELKTIDALRSSEDSVRKVIHLHRHSVGALFAFDSTQDFKDAAQVIAEVDQGGMALPDRDYYLKTDAKSVELRKQYVQHVRKMLELLGDPPARAAGEARNVMRIETGLAKGALDVTSRRDPNRVYHKVSVQELAVLAPGFDWSIYLGNIGAPSTQSLNVTEPEFFRHLNDLLKTVPLQEWKDYLRWHVVHSNAALLPSRFVAENFNFFDKMLSGTKELSPRWKRCVRYTAADLGEALGQKYVEQTFGAEGKERTLKMVQAVERALGEDIDQSPWMGPETKKQAQIKLAAITNRIGYPDRWRDYGILTVARGDALGNSLRANEFEFQRQLNKIGKPVDKNDWPYPPSTVNASYNPLLNNITFPAAVLQSPFYDNRADDALNYGGIGTFVGHELTHGFDDEGSQFDAQGNLRNWWTTQDKKEFNKRTQCLADQYSGFTAVDDVKLNGRLTLGENVADNGGVRIAYMALLSLWNGKEPPSVDGMTARQRFFLGWANDWCENISSEFSRMLATIDPHSPGKYRVNGTFSNMPEFREAFHCRPDAPMVRQNACRVW